MAHYFEEYDIVVIGGGHAGVEAALAAARLNKKTLLLTLNIDAIALMPCNPAIGGTAKGHLVRELDALGGEMGKAIDETFIQSKMLNTSKGPAVYSLRAQADKRAYQLRMRKCIETTDNLIVRQGEVANINLLNGAVDSVTTVTGTTIKCKCIVVCAGVYLNSRIIIGTATWNAGPQGLFPANHLTASLMDAGFTLRRFKTGTPARIDARTIDFDEMIPQAGDNPIVPFSFMTEGILENKAMCYLTYTTPETHDIIKANIHKAPMYSGLIKGTGARYCPSIEDKVMRFADKERHPIFLEPEGLDTFEWYVQGMSTGMPEEVQWEIYRSIPGLRRAKLTRLAYAIEYDCIDPTQLKGSLEAKHVDGLFFAGQVNGTSGYEEAAIQGLLAGINASLKIENREAYIPLRSEAYLGVLIDDLTVKGVDEPYRMMTSRAEYRLLLRQDNADLRLTEVGRQIGLVDDERYEKMLKKQQGTYEAIEYLKSYMIKPCDDLNEKLAYLGESPISAAIKAYDLLKRPQLPLKELASIVGDMPNWTDDVCEQAEILIKYEGYLEKQVQQVEHFKRSEGVIIPNYVDYHAIGALRIEARQKLTAQRPTSLGQASRIPGVSPGDISVLMVWLEKRRREGIS